jgi:hypothetical protein
MNDLPWEDGLLERKLESDKKDFLKTFVAFANSVRPGHTAVVLIGERGDGSIQGVSDPDEIQKKIRRECERIYPDIVWRSAVYDKDGKPCVRVEIEYSGDTPHFGEAAWIRRGSESVKANNEMFQRLIELRSSVVREIALRIGQRIFIEGDQGSVSFNERIRSGHPRWPGTVQGEIKSVNGFWVTFEVFGPPKKTASEPIDRLMLSWQDTQLKVIVKA